MNKYNLCDNKLGMTINQVVHVIFISFHFIYMLFTVVLKDKQTVKYIYNMLKTRSG